MQDLPHHYAVTATTLPGGEVTLDSPGLEAIRSAAPPEFGGSGGRWSPETLLVAAVADCFVLSFEAIARASRLAWSQLECAVTGTLDKVDGKLRFTQLDVRAELTLPNGDDSAKAERLLHKAEAACLITNSMTASVELTTRVEVST